MGGVFMHKLSKRVMICGLLAAICWGMQLLKDREQLNKCLIRFHVVAHSDSAVDQSRKLAVRDAILSSLEADLQTISDIESAKAYLQENIPKIQCIADQTLAALGFDGSAQVSLCKEAFDIRHYDTFSLPSGVYESLRIVIGDGLGHNWWCVSFPALCLPATTTGFETAAVGAGFSEPLTKALSDRQSCEIRFFLLDQLGRLENMFFQE